MNTLFPKFQNNLEKTENTPTPDVLNKSKNIDIQQTQTQQEKVQKKKVATQKLVALYCGSRFGNSFAEYSSYFKVGSYDFSRNYSLFKNCC